MFAPSLKEILAIGLPLLAFATLTEGQPKDVQFMAALCGGLLGATFWFLILKAEFVNPFKFIIIFIILPGFLLGGSYYVYRKPAELKPIMPQLERYVEGEIDKDDPAYLKLHKRRRDLLLGLAKDCGIIWFVGSILAGIVFCPMYIRCINRFDYAFQDSKQSRAQLGRIPTEVHPRDLPPKLEDANTERVSIPSNLPLKPRVRETTGEKEGLLVGADSEGDEENYWGS